MIQMHSPHDNAAEIKPIDLQKCESCLRIDYKLRKEQCSLEKRKNELPIIPHVQKSAY